MSAQVQLEMFKEEVDTEVLQIDLNALKESHHAVRKKLFGQQAEIMKIVMRQQEELDYLRMKMGLSCLVGKRSESDRPSEIH